MTDLSDLDTLLADLVSGDEQRAEAAVDPLAALGAQAVPGLDTLLAGQDADGRWWALRTLAQMSDPPLDRLWNGLEDPSADVRQCAALGLSSHPDQRSVPALLRHLADPDGLVAHLSIAGLVQIGEAAVPYLIEAMKVAPRGARLNAVRAMAEIADPRAIQSLMDALQEDSALMQFWAEEGLDRMGLDMVYFKPE